MIQARSPRNLLEACILSQRIRAAIRRKLARAIRSGRSIALAEVECWALARWPDFLDDASTRVLVREIAGDYCARTRWPSSPPEPAAELRDHPKPRAAGGLTPEPEP